MGVLRQVMCAGIVLAMCAPAQADVSAETERSSYFLVHSVTLDDLQLLLNDLGATFMAAGENAEGEPFIFGQMPNGLTFGAYTVCAGADGRDCRGVEFMAVYSSRASVAEVMDIDRDYAAISLYKADDNTVHVSRYVILDNGVTWANLIENANVFHLLCGKVSERLQAFPQDAPQ
ncbi:YbjN domain-containing protein [Hyphomonas pacifica]|uniref:YbjN domain-containing protein n=1 Tax=Hyphomonas pacifica TaxID=1280941 RepID=UPI0011BF542E|nr:YbjN domain-containing protein [Hyphomonas pacifica]